MMNRYLIGILSLLCLTTGTWAIQLDHVINEEDRERLFEQAEGSVEQSKKLREELAKESPPDQNYREIASEEESQWQREIDGILAE